MSHDAAPTPEASTAPVPGGPERAQSNGNILIVDDTPVNLRLLSKMLGEQGYHVRPVPNGPLALAAARAELPDLILLDIRMPEMDGYQVCEELKADARTRDVPIIFVSALDATQDKVRAFTAGGVDYVTKPFRAEEVLARVGTHLALRALHEQLQEANARMAAELALAGEVQASFLPSQVPEVPGWQLSATLIPAREASGDFYDFVSLPGGQWGMVVADVTDKGAGAALYMALSCTLIRTYAVEYPRQPERVLGAVNRRILEDCSASQFVTVFYGILDPAKGTLAYSNAGHCPPCRFRTSGDRDVHELARTGIPLGIYGDRTWRQETDQLDVGDVLVLYTDGITEAHHSAPSLFGKERLKSSVLATLDEAGSRLPSPQKIQDGILVDVQGFVGGAPQSDDIALIILARK
jgi:sigma-B regulation protein RsbU (phosphoserine phosphatase)